MSNPEPKQVLAILNALSLAELSRVDGELERARQSLEEMGQEDLGQRLEDARRSLREGDIREFRRAVSNVTARLGHLK